MEKILMLKHQSDSIPDSPILFIIVFQSILKKVFSIELTLTNHSQKMWLIGIFLASTIGSYQILLLLICIHFQKEYGHIRIHCGLHSLKKYANLSQNHRMVEAARDLSCWPNPAQACISSCNSL